MPLTKIKTLPKGTENCNKCGRNYRPERRRSAHVESAECKAGQVERAYTEKGWVVVTEATCMTLGLAGVPVEHAHGAWREEARLNEDMPQGARITSADTHVVKATYAVPYVPAHALRMWNMATRLGFRTQWRIRVIAAYWEHPELIESLEALMRLSGKDEARTQVMRELKETGNGQGQTVTELSFGGYGDEDELET